MATRFHRLIWPTRTVRSTISFSENEIAHLSLAIVAINGWNRLNVAARTVPGGYVAGSTEKMHAAAH